jgi:hypothetical protein
VKRRRAACLNQRAQSDPLAGISYSSMRPTGWRKDEHLAHHVAILLAAVHKPSTSPRRALALPLALGLLVAGDSTDGLLRTAFAREPCKLKPRSGLGR